jgi:hypothetical protein
VSIWGPRSGSRVSCKSDIPDLLRGHSPKAKTSTLGVPTIFDFDQGNRKLDAG